MSVKTRDAIAELRALLPRGSVVYGLERQYGGDYDGWYSVMLLIDGGDALCNISAMVYDALDPWLHITPDGRRVAAIAWGGLGWVVVEELSVLLYGGPKELLYRPLCYGYREVKSDEEGEK